VIRTNKVALAAVVFLVLAFFLSCPAYAQFETRSNRSLATNESAIAAGDFNLDGKMDVAVAGNELYILLGNGDGTFQAPSSYFIPAYFIAVADFNGDGIPDLALSNDGNSVSVLLGKGDGTFQNAIITSTTASNTFMAVGDFNNDKKPDIVVIDYPYMSVLLGNGDGTFQPPIDSQSFVGANKLALGNFNNDSKLDVIATGSFFGSAEYGVFLGNGDGSLQPPVTTELPTPADWVTAADFNKDGHTDIAIGWYLATGLSVYLGRGDGTFGDGAFYDTTFEADQIVAYDLNGDGAIDLAVPTGKPVGLTVLWGNGDGTFRPAELFPTLHVGQAAVADLNGDGLPDFAFAVDPFVTTMLNTGSLRLFPTSPVGFTVQTINTASTPKKVMLQNIGTKPISITSVKSTGDFQVKDGCGPTLSPGSSCALRVTFLPKTSGNLRGEITLLDSASSKPQVVLLSGVSTALKVTPSQISFGNQKVGTTSQPQQIAVTNESSATVTITAIQTGGNDNNDFHQTNNCGSQLNAGASCNISVTFSPRKSGTRTGNVNFTLAGEPSPRYAVLVGTGT